MMMSMRVHTLTAERSVILEDQFERTHRPFELQRRRRMLRSILPWQVASEGVGSRCQLGSPWPRAVGPVASSRPVRSRPRSNRARMPACSAPRSHPRHLSSSIERSSPRPWTAHTPHSTVQRSGHAPRSRAMPRICEHEAAERCREMPCGRAYVLAMMSDAMHFKANCNAPQ